jgi:hypothetical protein
MAAPSGNVYGRNRSTGAAPAASTTTQGNKTGAAAGVLYSTGLFAPRNEKSKAIGTVQVKEDVVLKAGSYINLYENDKKTSDNSPIFRMQVREGILKAKA